MAKKAATVAESRRMERLSRMGCVACRVSLGTYSAPQIHHLTSGGRRVGHDATIPLCPWHHEAVPHSWCDPPKMREIYGPSLAESRAEFEASFGTQHELLEKVNAWLSYNHNRV